LNPADATAGLWPAQRLAPDRAGSGAIAAPQPGTWRSPPQSDVELMTKKEVLDFKRAPRLEQIGDVGSKSVDDREHRTG